MLKEKKKIPYLRFSQFNKEWRTDSLKNYFEERKEKGVPEYPLYSLTIEDGIIPKSKRYEREHLVSDINDAYKVMLENDFAFNPMNLRFGALKRHKSNFGINVSKYYNIFYCNEIAEPNFFEYYLTTYNLIQYYNKMATGSLEEKKRVHYLDFINFKIPIPERPEQQKIASFLTSIDNCIQTLEKKKTLLEQYKKGVMQKIFKQELRFKDDDGKKFPKWEYKNGNLLFQSISDKNHHSDLPILAVTQDQGAIPRHLINYNIGVSEKSVSSYKVVQIGDFIISLRSFQGGIEYSNYKGICSPAYIILKPIEEMDRNFYKYYLKTSSYIKELTRKLEGIRDGKMISYKYFSEIKLPYPSVKEQTKIANFLSAIDKNIELVNTKIEQTKTYKKGLLQQMFV